MPPCFKTASQVQPWPRQPWLWFGTRASVGRTRNSYETSQIKRICPTYACTTPRGEPPRSGAGCRAWTVRHGLVGRVEIPIQNVEHRVASSATFPERNAEGCISSLLPAQRALVRSRAFAPRAAGRAQRRACGCALASRTRAGARRGRSRATASGGQRTPSPRREATSVGHHPVLPVPV